MIIENKQGKAILKGGKTRIAFAVNTEGVNDYGFAGMISRKYWPELAYIGEAELGTVLTKVTDEGIIFYALVCHSLNNGWCNKTETIQKCFDSIESDEPVASIFIGIGLIDILSGANFEEINKGMEMYKTKIILY